MIHHGDCELLRCNGWTEHQIECLVQLKQQYLTREYAQRLADQRRLEFVRWLVLTGKLSECSA